MQAQGFRGLERRAAMTGVRTVSLLTAYVAFAGASIVTGQNKTCFASTAHAPFLLQKGTGSVVAALETAAAAPLKVLAYNVWWWGSPCFQSSDYSCLPGMHNYWKSLPTMDLVGVQECDGGWPTLKKYLGGTADYLDLLPIDGALCTLYNPARFELLSYGRQNVGTGSASYRYAAYGRFQDKASGENIFFVNTHWDHQRQDPYGHAEKTKSMIDASSSSGDVLIVVGDFNQNAYIGAFKDVFQGKLGLRLDGVGSAYDDIDLIWTNNPGSSACNSPQDDSGGRGSDHNPVFCEMQVCEDCPAPTTTTTTEPPRTDDCVDFGSWPDLDAVSCGQCTALVLTAASAGRCDRYCESFGHRCIAAAEEQNENCQVKFHVGCDEVISGTSDMLCTCERVVSATTSTSPTNPTTTGTSTQPMGPSFQLVDGGRGRACRGSDPDDNAAQYYTVEGAGSLSLCQSLCSLTHDCRGIEFNPSSGRCEVWTHPIQSSRAVAGYDCYLYASDPRATAQPGTSTEEPVTNRFQPVDGGNGRACRGSDPGDNAADYYTVGGASSLFACQLRCMSTPECSGIEFNPLTGRCEVWTHPIQSSRAVAGYDCFLYAASSSTTTTTTSVTPATKTTTSSTMTTTTAISSDTCYGDLSAVAVEEGNGAGEIDTLSLEECKSVCLKNSGCQSFAFCPHFQGCYLKDKRFTGNEPTREFYDCKTYYKTSCDGTTLTPTPSASPAPTPNLGGPSSLKIMTYNTVFTGYPCCGGNTVAQFGAKIREVAPAVTGIQECQDGGSLASAAGYQEVPGTKDSNNILYDSNQVSYVAGSGGFLNVPSDCYAQRYIAFAKFRTIGGNQEFWFFNTHLPHNGCDASSRDIHAEIARMLLQKRRELGAENQPTVVTCDCNPFASSGSSQGSFESNLASAGIKKAYEGRGTFGGYAGLDKIFYSPQWTASNGADHGTGSSDHPAITADLALSGSLIGF